MNDDEKPRILGVRLGVNPNSSSLGVDVTFLLFGTAGAVAAGLFLSALIRGRRRRVTVHGERAVAPTER
jgi:hypothetical protein